MSARCRAFTLLEVLLASALASMVVLTAAGVMAGMQRAHGRAMDRMDQAQQMSTAREVIRRAVSSLAMTGATNSTPAGAAGGAPPGGFPNDFTRGRAPRFAVVDDPRFDGKTQRVELVVHTPPVDRDLAALLRRDGRTSTLLAMTPSISIEELDAAEDGERDADAAGAAGGDRSSAGGRVVRGAFEIRPERTEDGTRLDLWWVPSALGVVDQAWGPSAPVDAGGAAPILEGVTRCVWQVYHRRVMLDEFAAAWPDDLPAYVRVEIETDTGLFARWTFEVDYIVTTSDRQGTQQIAPDEFDEVPPGDRPEGSVPESATPPASGSDGAS